MNKETILLKIQDLKIKHHECFEDNWYSCPMSNNPPPDDALRASSCDCGAQEHNAKVDSLIKIIAETI